MGRHAVLVNYEIAFGISFQSFVTNGWRTEVLHA